MKAFIEGDTAHGAYSALAPELKMTAAAVAVAVHRLRQRYRELVRNEIAQTVSSPDEVAAEMRHLLLVISR